MVRIRLKRTGRRHQPSYRLTAVDKRASRDGKALEELGGYDPDNKKPELRVTLKKERIEFWLKSGAQPTPTVLGLLKSQGIAVKAS